MRCTPSYSCLQTSAMAHLREEVLGGPVADLVGASVAPENRGDAERRDNHEENVRDAVRFAVSRFPASWRHPEGAAGIKSVAGLFLRSFHSLNRRSFSGFS